MGRTPWNISHPFTVWCLKDIKFPNGTYINFTTELANITGKATSSYTVGATGSA